MKNQNARPSAKKKRRKKKKSIAPVLILVLLVACIAVALVLYFSGGLSEGGSSNTVNSRVAIAYIDYSDSSESKMTINREGRVLETLAETPEDLPKVSGMEFSKITQGELLEYDDPLAFEYVMSVVEALKKFNIYVSEVAIDENKEVSAYVNDVTILFGPDDGKIDLKVSDLNDFFEQVKNLKGTLHMEEVNDKVGYTFKQESDKQVETRAAEDATTEETTSAEETATEEQYVEEWQEPAQEEQYVEEWQEPAYEEQYVEEWQEPVYEEQYVEQWQEPVYEEQYVEQWQEPVYY